MLGDLFKRLDTYLFVDKNGVRNPKYVTGDRFNGGIGIKLPRIKRKGVKESIIYGEETEPILKVSDSVVDNLKDDEEFVDVVDSVEISVDENIKSYIHWEGFIYSDK